MTSAKRILIVDDEPNIRLVLRTALECPEYQTVTAEDGAEALALIKSEAFDLVLLDLRMPVMEGMEVLETLRERKIEVPVIIVTAHGDIPNAVRAMKLGAIDFLAKPTAPEALRRVIADVLERTPGSEESVDTAGSAAETADVQYATNLGRAKHALNQRDFGKADVFLRQAIAVHPDSAEAHNLMGVLHECRNEHDDSYREYRAALKADRHYEPAKHNMQRYYERFTFGASDLPLDTGNP